MRLLKKYVYSILKVLSLAFLVGLNARISYAAPRPPPLTDGMTYNEVIKLWDLRLSAVSVRRSERTPGFINWERWSFVTARFIRGDTQMAFRLKKKITETDEANSNVALGGPEGKESLQVEELLTEIMKSGSPDDATGSSGSGETQ